jgi:hypothetical protein
MAEVDESNSCARADCVRAVGYMSAQDHMMKANIPFDVAMNDNVLPAAARLDAAKNAIAIIHS